MESKSIFASKTAIVNALIALAPLYPPVLHWVQANPTLTLTAIGLINVALRSITKGRITLFGADS